jgi:hypothetical protein
MRFGYKLAVGGILVAAGACSGSSNSGTSHVNGGGGGAGNSNGGAGGSDTDPNLPPQVAAGGSFEFHSEGDAGCPHVTCASLGWACGYMLDACHNVINCADEGLTCMSDQVCTGGLNSPTVCVAGGDSDCSECAAIPRSCDAASPTRIKGRVITPGKADNDTGNQLGVPNAIVYILRGETADPLPAISAGIPSGGTSCDRCEDQDLGPVLVGAVTDATGSFTLD